MNNHTTPQVVDASSSQVTGEGGVSAVTVSITLSVKPLGADAFIKMEETYSFVEPVHEGVALVRRDEMLDILREQALEQAKSTADQVRELVASTPKGNVSVHPVAPAPAPAGAFAGQAAPVSGPAATVAVANGAAPATGQWMSVASRFGDGDLRFLPTTVYPSEQLEAEVGKWLTAQGLNPDAFKVWDNRPGPKGLEAGVPNGCVAAVKISKDAQAYVPGDIANLAAARVKFNSNGSLYIWFTKEAEAAIKYGALDRLKVAAGGTEEAF
jgi:hypothetical protein